MRFMKMLGKVLPTACVVALVVSAVVVGQTVSTKKDSTKTVIHTKQLSQQITCPIQGDTINKKLFVDYKGKRIYVCCEGCIAQVKKDPEKYIKMLEAKGQSVETIPTASKKESSNIKADTSMKDVDMKGMKMSGESPSKDVETGYWTCTMHPEIHQAGPGNCPKCGMTLVFKKSEKDTTKMKSMDHSKMKM
jgi:YHS domain-containing protein